MKKLNYNRAGTFTASLIIVLCMILNTAHNAQADGEIILCPGDKYAIPCLAQLLPGQEYEIEIENPDIVGLDETGKSIVAVASGTTEVTVRLMNPDAGYLYVFAVADVFAQPAAGIYDEAEKDYVYEQYTDETETYGWDSDNIPEPYEYDEVSPSSRGNETGRPYKEPGSDAEGGADAGTEQGAVVDTDRDADAGTDQRAGVDTDKDADTGTDQRAGVDTDKDADTGTEQGTGIDTDRDADAGTEQGTGINTDRDADVDTEQGSGHDTNGSEDHDDMSRNYLRYPPVTFTHGTGKYDILIPPHYTLWICAHSEGPVSVLYVGVNGAPVRYRTVKNMIFVCSDDLPSGNCRIQVIAADAAGRVSVMEQYGAARQGLPDSDKFTMLNDGK